MEKSLNPSAIRSRKMIVEALLRLMKRKKYTAITITDVANEAQIGRKTFYRHFYTLDDVLDEYVNELFAEYRAMLKEAQICDIYEHIPCYFRFWNEHMEFLQLLEKNNLLFFILKKYDVLMPEIFTLLPCVIEKGSDVSEYFLSYTAGGFWSMLCKWISRGGKETPEEMTEIFKAFFSQVVGNISGFGETHK